MKTITHLTLVALLALGIAHPLTGCGESSEIGGTETGTTDSELDTSKVASRLETGGSALVPRVVASAIDSSLSSGKTTREAGGNDEWSLYLDPDNAYVLTDVFGDPEEEPRVVTKIRVLLDQFGDAIDHVFMSDPDLLCDGADSMSEGDSVTLPFYGAVDNGAVDDRHFDCVFTEGDGGDRNRTTIYGQDSSGVLHVAVMMDDTTDNTEDVASRGDLVRIRTVSHAVYSEMVEAGTTIVYLDLNFSHATVYNGLDDSFGTDDDVIFKSRTRITGRITLDAAGEIIDATGEFTGTKYDSGPDMNGTPVITMTRSVGRGSFGDGDFSLFKIDSDVDAVADLDRTFCIRAPADDSGLPAFSDPANCTSLETDYAWAGSTFPFTISPELDQVFEDKPFYEDNDTDLIANDGSNFEIPTFSSEGTAE